MVEGTEVKTKQIIYSLHLTDFHLISFLFSRTPSVIQPYPDVSKLTAKCVIFCSSFLSLLTAQLLNGIFSPNCIQFS